MNNLPFVLHFPKAECGSHRDNDLLPIGSPTFEAIEAVAKRDAAVGVDCQFLHCDSWPLLKGIQPGLGQIIVGRLG